MSEVESPVITVSDILKILDQVPVWKVLTKTPGRLDALEKRIAALEEAKMLPGVSPGEPCPACGAHALRRTSSEKTKGHMAVFGARDEVWTCTSCGATDVRENVKNH